MVEIDWTIITYLTVALFALSGFFKGWWKEGVITFLLVILVFLLANPDIAQAVVDFTNRIIASVWDIFNFSSVAPVIDARSATTWIAILIIVLIIGVLLGRLMLRQSHYLVRPSGSILGALLGAVNGFLIINLIREYLDGRNLPGGQLPTEISAAGSSGVAGTASSGVTLTAVNVPSFTILDSYVPWVIIGLGFFVFLALLRNRVTWQSKKGYRKIGVKSPYGYRHF